MTVSEISTEEVGNSVREMAREAERAARSAVEAAILEVIRAAETARITSQQAIAQVEAVNKSVREMAEEVMRKAVEEAEAARAMSEQVISLAEEFSRSAKERLEKAAIAAEQSADLATREAKGARETTRAALHQAVTRAEEINKLAKELADEATRSARDAVESAKRAFHESLSKSIDRSEEAKRLRDFKEGRVTEVEVPLNKKVNAVELQEADRETMRERVPSTSQAVRTQPENAAEEAPGQEGKPAGYQGREETLPKTEPRRARWISAIGNSLRKSPEKIRESEEVQSLEDLLGQEISDSASGTSKAIDKDELFKGIVQIGIPLGNSPEKLAVFEDQLMNMENMKVARICGSEDEGTSIFVSLHKPLALIGILSEFPAVESIGKEDEKIIVALKKRLEV